MKNQIKSNEIIFIINPNSGNKKASLVVSEIANIDSEITSVVTKDLSHLEQTFAKFIDSHKVFVVVGGDGTVNESLKYLYGKPGKILAVLPAGSGNGFARELGFKKDLNSLITDAKNGVFIDIDVLQINNRLCINAAGLGFDSFVAHRFQNSKGRGLSNYIKATLNSIMVFKPFTATISHGDSVNTDQYQMITIANTRQFGNNAFISPNSKPNNRKFDLVLVKPFPFYRYIDFVIKLFTKKLKKSKYIEYQSIIDEVAISSAFKNHHVDGEPDSFTDELRVKLMSKTIRVLKSKTRNLKQRNSIDFRH